MDSKRGLNRRGFMSLVAGSMVARSTMAAGAGLFVSPTFVRPNFARSQDDQGQRNGRTSDPVDLPTPDPKTLLQHNEDKIQSDVERLYSLASELRDEVQKSNSKDVLSLDLLKKAEEVEKLAHQIRNLAKG